MKNLTLFGLGLLGLLSILIASPSLSATINTEISVGWQDGCQPPTNLNRPAPAPPGHASLGTFTCFEPLAKAGGLDGDATDNSPMLSVSQCENIDVLSYDDMLGDPTDANTFTVYSCGNPTNPAGNGPNEAGFDANDILGICWVMEGADGVLDSDPASNEAIYGIAAEWMYVDPTGTHTGDMGRIIVRCNP